MIDKETFDHIYNRYCPALLNHAKKIVGRIETAENVVSGFFANLWEKRDEIVIHDKVEGYLYTGVTNACLKHLEHENVERKYCEYVQNLYEKSERLWMHDGENPENRMMEQETMSEFARAVDALQGQCKEVLELRIKGLSYQEIAEKMNITIGAVGNYIYRATAKLRKSIGNKP